MGYTRMEETMENIKELLPQRAGYVFVDQIDQLEHNKVIKGQKHINVDEPWVLGEEDNPIIPGSYLFETMSQFGGLLLFRPEESLENKVYNGYLYRIEQLKFLHHCKPGDTLFVESHCMDRIGNIFHIKTTVFVENKKISEGKFTYVLTKS